MLIIFVVAGAVIVVGSTLFYAYNLKRELSDLDIKFKQAQAYADSTAKTNLRLVEHNNTLAGEVVSQKLTIADQALIIDGLMNQKGAEQPAQPTATPNTSPNKKSVKGSKKTA